MKPLIFLLFLSLVAADAPQPVKLTTRSTAGENISIPVADHVTVVAFLRAGQQQSDSACRQLAETMVKNPDAKVIVAFSGPTPAQDIASFVTAEKIAWPVVADPDYALSGKLSIHVWPTTVVLAADGTQAAHLAGLPQSFASDLSAYLDFAAKKIDATALSSRLSTRQVVTDSPDQMASRHLHMANALIEKGQFDQAASEIESGLKLAPSDHSLRAARVELLLKQKKNDAALAAADELKDSVPPWQLQMLRAQSLIALERWTDAKTAAAEALKLNPHPAEAYYLNGLIATHESDWKSAADAFRRAYEEGAKAR